MRRIWHLAWAGATAALLVVGCGGAERAARLPGPPTVAPDSVTIARGGYGVPHIFAPTDAGVAYGLAWAHAEDDFGTIQRSLLRGKAMMGRLDGRDGAATDYVVHLLRIPALVDAHYTDLSPAYRRVLRGYAEGFNAYARAHPDERLLDAAFPITPKDLTQAHVLTLSIIAGAGRALKSITNNDVPPVPGRSSAAPDASPEQDAFEAHPSGSNGFAMNAGITADGGTYLAINPHNPFTGPISWYEAQLTSGEGWNIHGALFPGLPFVTIGANRHLAWTHTLNFPDRVDVYRLTLNPDDENQYRYDGQWLDFEKREADLHVNLWGLVTIPWGKEVLWSKYGAVMKNDSGAYAIRLGANRDVHAGEEWYRMNKATTLAEFRDALRMNAISTFNVVYADRAGNIFYLDNGQIPDRAPGYDWQMTLPGDTSATRWTQLVPTDSLPQLLNPPSGYLYSFNTPYHQATAPGENLEAGSVDPTMGYPEDTGVNRGARFRHLMQGRDTVSYAGLKNIKYDRCLPADSIRYPTNVSALFEMNPDDYPKLRASLQTLHSWDHCTDAQSTGATLYRLVWKDLQPDDLAPDQIPAHVVSRKKVAGALRRAQQHLRTYFGTTAVPLGQYQRHARGETNLPIGGFFDVLAATESEPCTEDGPCQKGRLRATGGDSFIQFVRFPPPDSSASDSSNPGPQIETVSAYGASEDPDSPHYNDQMTLYDHQKLKPATLDRQAVMARAERVYHPGG